MPYKDKIFEPDRTMKYQTVRRQRDRVKKRLDRTSDSVIPEDIVSQVKRLYPDGKLPNCRDGRYR